MTIQFHVLSTSILHRIALLHLLKESCKHLLADNLMHLRKEITSQSVLVIIRVEFLRKIDIKKKLYFLPLYDEISY